jgi:hypothetical protein
MARDVGVAKFAIPSGSATPDQGVAPANEVPGAASPFEMAS